MMTTLKLGLIKLGGYYPKGPNLTGAGIKTWVMIDYWKPNGPGSEDNFLQFPKSLQVWDPD